MGFFTGLYELVVTKHFSQLTDASTALAGVVTPFLTLGLTVKIMWQGINIIRGQGGSNHLLDLFANNIKVALVVIIGLTTANYQTYVLNFFDMTKEGNFAQTFIQAFFPGADSPAEALDKVFETGLDTFKSLVSWGLDNIGLELKFSFGFIPFTLNLTGIPVILTACVLILCILILCVLGFADIVTNGLAMIIVMGVGPVFIATYAFEATQSFFHSWLTTALKWSFTSAVIAIVCGMAALIMQDFLHEIHLADDWKEILAVCGEIIATTIALMLLTAKAANLAGDMFGGMGVHGAQQGAMGTISNTMGGAYTGIRKAFGGGAGKAGAKGGSGKGSSQKASEGSSGGSSKGGNASGETAGAKAVKSAQNKPGGGGANAAPGGAAAKGAPGGAAAKGAPGGGAAKGAPGGGGAKGMPGGGGGGILKLLIKK